MGDIIVVSVKEAIPRGRVKKGEIQRAVVVRVERRVMHPLYKKIIRKSSKFHAHDADNRFKTGDAVRIRECRPLSKTKRWKVVAEAAK